MLKRKRFLKQSLAVLLSLTMSLGPCASVSFAAQAGESGVEASVDAGSEAELEEASGAEAGTEEVSGAEETGSGSEEADASCEEASGEEVSEEEASGEEQSDDSAAETSGEGRNGAETTEENVTADETGAVDDDKSEAETSADAETGADNETGTDAETGADNETGADAVTSVDAETGTADETAVSAETEPAAETDPAAETASETETSSQTETEASDPGTTSETIEAEDAEPKTESTETEAVENEAEPAASDAVMEESLEATVEDMQVTVSYEKGVFPENVTLDVQLIDQESEDQMEIEGKVLEAFNKGAGEDKNYSAVNTQALDIRILDADGKEVQPDTDKGKVYVSVSDIDRPLDQNGNAVPDKALHVFHMADAGDEETEELEKIETGEETLLSGDLLAAEGAVINDLNTQEAAEGTVINDLETPATEAAPLPETASVTVAAEHFSLYVLSWKVGNQYFSNTSLLYDKNTYFIVDMICDGDMLDDHGFDVNRGDKLNAVQVISGGDVISLNTSNSDHSKWTVTTKKTGKAVFNVNYSTINGGKTTTWVSQIRVEVEYYAEGTTSGMCGVDVRWSLSGTTLTISGSGEMYDYKSPADPYLDSLAIGIVPWVAYTKKITAVNIGAGVTSVGNFAFYEFEKLSSVTLPSGLKKIGNFAFSNAAALKSLTLPATLEEIGEDAFYGCNELGNITIPSGMIYIHVRAFYKTKMASNKAKNVITNNSSVKLYGLTEYNQNYSTCPTGIIESETISNDKTPPRMVSVTVSNIEDRNVEYKATARDDLNDILTLYGFVTTEDSVTDPERVRQGGEYINELSEYSSDVTVTKGNGYYEYSMKYPRQLFYYYELVTQLTPNTNYYFYVVAEDSGGNVSGVYKTSFKTAAESRCLSPKVSPEAGTYTGDQTVTLTQRTAGSTMYYQLDEDDWKKYTAPFTLSASVSSHNLNVRAVKAGLEDSITDYYNYVMIDPTPAMSGNCGTSGNNVTWKLLRESADKTSCNDLTLEISGTGAMQSFSSCESAPWYPYHSEISHIRIKNGVTVIGNHAFEGLSLVAGELIIPDSVTRVGNYSCSSMISLTKLKLGSGLKTIGESAFEYLEEVDTITIPASVISIGRKAFEIYYFFGDGDKQQIINYSAVALKSRADAGDAAHYNEDYQRLMADSTVRPFVKRMYQVCMGRVPDASGLNFWTQQVMNGKYQGIRLAANFVFSAEFTKKNYCNEHFVRQIYPALMNRTPDPSGLNFWVGQLDSGKLSREALLNSFASTNEYIELCDKAGFDIGRPAAVPKYGTQQYGPCAVCGKKSKVVQFVERMYTECLGRSAESGGLNYWSEALCKHTQTAKSLLHNFFLSQELKNKHLSNEEYVRRIYKAMLNRSPDSGGLKYWKERLDKGESPTVVINSFIDSSEFKKICDDYGIQRK